MKILKKLIYCEPFDTKSGWNVLSKWLFFVCLVVVFGEFFFVKPKSKMAPTAEHWENKYFLTETGNLVNPKLHINSHLNVSLS